MTFKRSQPQRKLGILELVYYDVCGPFMTGGSLYFVTFIDDQPRNRCVYTLKMKNQVLACFKSFMLWLRDRQAKS